MGFEPTTSTLARLRSTPELYPHCAERDINYHIQKKLQAFILNFCKNFFLLSRNKVLQASSGRKPPEKFLRGFLA